MHAAMSIDVQTEIQIRRPRAEVAAYMFDPRNDLAWTKGIVDCRPLTDGPLRVGSRVERTAAFLGRRFTYQYEVVAADGERFVEMVVERPFPMNVRYELDDAPDGTVARIRARGDARGFFRVARPLLARMVRRSIAADLAALRLRLEQVPAVR
jgi:Polyketide cyclase / dehydrase and lipid transport